MNTPYEPANEIRPLTTAGWPLPHIMARAKAILTLTDFIRDLDDGYSERLAFIHPVAARQCDNCGYRCDDPARIPRRLLDMCLDDASGSPCCCDVCAT